MTAPNIAPRMDGDEPTCSGETCPRFYWSNVDDQCMSVFCGRGDDLLRFCQSQPEKVPCIPMLRCQRDELREERDAARRELCEADAGVGMGEGVGLNHYTAGLVANDGVAGTDFRIRVMEYAVERQWSYLYAPAPPATGEEGVEG
jgi:hypothetical protein